MKLVKDKKGCAIAVYNPDKRSSKKRKSPKEVATQLLAQGRADFTCPADYTEGSPLDELVKAFIDGVAARRRMELACPKRGYKRMGQLAESTEVTGSPEAAGNMPDTAAGHLPQGNEGPT